MQTFKARLTGLLAHMGEQVGVFAREEFSRAVAHAIMPREATHNPALSVLMVVNDHLDSRDDSPLNLSLRAFIYSILREVTSEECDDSPLSNDMRDFVAQTISAILAGDLDESEEPGMMKAYQDLIGAIDGASDAFSEDSRIRALVREELDKFSPSTGLE